MILTVDGGWCPLCGWESGTSDPYLMRVYAADHVQSSHPDYPRPDRGHVR